MLRSLLVKIKFANKRLYETVVTSRRKHLYSNLNFVNFKIISTQPAASAAGRYLTFQFVCFQFACTDDGRRNKRNMSQTRSSCVISYNNG